MLVSQLKLEINVKKLTIFSCIKIRMQDEVTIYRLKIVLSKV